MSKTLIYINNTLADLTDDTIVAITFQAMSVGDFQGRTISYTNRIKIPITPTNNQIFQHANDIHSKTRKPYSVVTVRVVQNGLETLSNALGVLQESDGMSYHLEIYDNAKGLFDTLKDRYVDEMDLGIYGPFDDDFINTHKNNSSPGCPVIDYGRMLVPEVDVANKEFDAVIFDPWTNPDDDNVFYTGGPQWELSTNDYIGVTLFTTGPNNVSDYLHGPFNFRKGKQYRIILLCETISGSTNGSIQIELHGDGDGVANSQAVGSQSINSVGDHVFDQTVTADDDYQLIGIIASQLTGGTNKEVILKSIRIQPINAIDIKAPYYLPTLSYLQILTDIVANAGYEWGLTFTGADSDLISNLAITFSKSELKYNDRLLDKYKFIAHATGLQTIAAIPETPLTLIEFTDVELNGSEEWYDSSVSQYQVPVIDFDLRVRLFVRLTVNVTALGGTQINFFLSNGSSTVEDEFGFPISHVITGVGQETFTLELPATIIGDIAKNFRVTINANGGGVNSIEILEGTFYSELDDTPVGRVHASNLILPDMLQKEFFADFLYRFGCMVEDTSGTVDTIPLEHIIEDRVNAKDWTAKRDQSYPDHIKYIHSAYGQSNYISDSPDDSPGARGLFAVSNVQMDEEKTLYTSPFRVVDYVSVDGIRVCRVPVFDFESNDPLKVSGEFEPGVRLVYLRSDASTDPEVKYNSVVDTAHRVAVYDDPVSSVKANWQHFIDNYYNNLTTHLQEAKIITRHYFLSPVDIASLDLTKLIFDSGAYFKIEKVQNHIPGVSTKVELFKVS